MSPAGGRWGCGSNLWRPTAVGNPPRFPKSRSSMVGATLATARIEGEDDADMGRRHAEEFLELLVGKRSSELGYSNEANGRAYRAYEDGSVSCK